MWFEAENVNLCLNLKKCLGKTFSKNISDCFNALISNDHLYFSTEKIETDRMSCLQCGLLQNEAICVKLENNSQQGSKFAVDEERDEMNVIDEEENLDKDPNWKSTSATSKKLNFSELYSCENCDKKFKTVRALERHKEFESSNGKNCGKCQKKFKTDIVLKSHKCKLPEAEIATKKVRKRRSENKIVSPKKKKIEGQYCYLCFRDFAMPTRYEITFLDTFFHFCSAITCFCQN